MRRPMAILILGALLASGSVIPGAEAQSRRKPKRFERTVVATYYGPAAAVSTPALLATAWCHPYQSVGCVRFTMEERERYVSLELHDATGLTAGGLVLDGTDEFIGDVCGMTKRPLAPGGGYVEVWLVAGTCYGTNTPSVVSTGTVVATFSNLP